MIFFVVDRRLFAIVLANLRMAWSCDKRAIVVVAGMSAGGGSFFLFFFSVFTVVVFSYEYRVSFACAVLCEQGKHAFSIFYPFSTPMFLLRMYGFPPPYCIVIMTDGIGLASQEARTGGHP